MGKFSAFFSTVSKSAYNFGPLLIPIFKFCEDFRSYKHCFGNFKVTIARNGSKFWKTYFIKVTSDLFFTPYSCEPFSLYLNKKTWYSPYYTVYFTWIFHTHVFFSPFKVWPEELGLHVRGGAAEAGVQEGHRWEVQEENRGHRQVRCGIKFGLFFSFLSLFSELEAECFIRTLLIESTECGTFECV